MTKNKFVIICLIALIVALLGNTININPSDSVDVQISASDKVDEPIMTAEYTSLGVPNINSYFKTYMDYRYVTNQNSAQYKFINTWGWLDSEGFMRCNAEKTLGIDEHYYLIALGSYYGTEIGTKYRITLDTGRVFYGVLADCKADIHTNSTHQYSKNNDVVEFLVDARQLNKTVKRFGSANVYMPLNGNVAKIEKINFVMR